MYFLEVTKAQAQTGGKPLKPETRYVDIYKEKPIKVVTKVLVPVKEHPKVILNFKLSFFIYLLLFFNQ